MLQPEFYRAALLLGADSLARLGTKKVAVLGVGGVGSFVVESLARGGVGHLVLVDNDRIDRTNINRQLPATQQTVGQLKTKVLAQRVQSINHSIQVTTREVFVLPENIEDILPPDVDYLVDALDTVAAKIAIAQYGHAHGIPTISCMGAGNKVDPTAFQVADIYDTSVCPLCRVMRRELRRREVPHLKVVYSTERALTPDLSQLPSGEREELARQTAGGRPQPTPGSVSFVPPVAGMIAGGEVIKDLIGWQGREPSI